VLTAGEIALARTVFADMLPYDSITFVHGAGGNIFARIAFRNGNSAITLRTNIYFAPAYWRRDFSAGKAAAKGLFIHELTHVWQYLRLGTPRFLLRYAREFAASGFNAPRMYEYRQGTTPFHAGMLEAQAEMAGNYIEAKAGDDAAACARIAVNLAGSGLHGF